MVRWMAILAAGLCLVAWGCGSGDEASEAASDAAGKAAGMAGEMAGSAADMADAASTKLKDVAASAQEDPAAQCLALAAKKDWSAALTPCMTAAKANPDDLRIKHAVQQAQAAAEG